MDNNFNDVLYFGIAFDKFDILDFVDNFLAGVRANYFNSGCETQANRAVQSIKNDEYSFVYTMKNNAPLSWKVNKNGRPFQSAEAVDNESYRVNTYDDNGRIFKRIYFNNNHIWVKSEYINKESKNTEYVITPCVIEGQNILVKKHYGFDSTVQTYLYPKEEIPENSDYSVLAFADNKFLFFNSVPNKKFITKTVIHDDTIDNLGGFNFDSVDFDLNRNFNTTFDITSAEYLSKDNGNPYHKLTNSPYNQEVFEFDGNVNEENITVLSGEDKTPDSLIESCGENYSYYGELDSLGKRSGYGRTVTNQGNTAYEGSYLDDKRNGFGTFYYKNGKVNYIGNWKNNYREGFGVGFRGSDGTSHVGNWKNNVPDGIGARFDNKGNFIFLGKYVDGKKQGTGITIDENGKFIVSEFKDDEVVSSQSLEDLLKF